MGRRRVLREATTNSTEAPAAPRRNRRGLAAALAMMALAASAAALWVTTPGSVKHPNVLLITIDTLRADHLGCYGNKGAATPVLDALAARGVRFPTAVVPVPLTLPSHASILTGLNPLRHGARDNSRYVVPEGIRTAADWFHHAGYATGGFISGFPLVRHYGLAGGFDTYDDRLGHGTDPRLGPYVERTADQTTSLVEGWLDAHGGGGRPFFLWVHYFDPHAPYVPPEPYAARFPGRPYDGEIAFVDAQIGVLLRRLDALKVASRTLVLVTADHGESMGEHGEMTHGFFVYDATLRVPFILAGPGVPAGRTPEAVARAIDVTPTLLDLAGVPSRSDFDGRSLRSAIRGRDVPDAPSYAESMYTQDLGFAPLHGWRTARFKYIQAPRPELYDLTADPGETKDRIGEQGEAAVPLRAQLEEALRTTPPDASAKLTAEAAERLQALGYVSGPALPASAGAAVLDPKDGIGIVTRLETNMGIARVNPKAAADDLAAILLEQPRMMPARRYRAIALSQIGDFVGAAKELRVLEQEGAASVIDAAMLGECLRLAGRPGEALEVIERARAKDPDAPEPHLALARAYQSQGKLDEAAKEYQKLLALSPGHAQALVGQAELAEARGDNHAAEQAYRQVLSVDPTDTQATLKLSVFHSRAGRIREAEALLTSVVAREPKNISALHMLGASLARNGHPEAAIQYFERAVEAGDRTPAGYNALGSSRLDAGDLEGALKAFRLSLARDSRQPKVAQSVAQLVKAQGR